jgi:hypothetical protein
LISISTPTQWNLEGLYEGDDVISFTKYLETLLNTLQDMETSNDTLKENGKIERSTLSKIIKDIEKAELFIIA